MTTDPIESRRRYQFGHCFTGKEVIVFGGAESSAFGWIVKDNAIYTPLKDSWRTLPMINGPEARREACAWTGSNALVWGGIADDRKRDPLQTGGLYDPQTES